jgi:hypothetical protein
MNEIEHAELETQRNSRADYLSEAFGADLRSIEAAEAGDRLELHFASTVTGVHAASCRDGRQIIVILCAPSPEFTPAELWSSPEIAYVTLRSADYCFPATGGASVNLTSTTTSYWASLEVARLIWKTAVGKPGSILPLRQDPKLVEKVRNHHAAVLSR